ncbi:hypothetical protein L2E82_17149 [Cichorium intybus]|uniref:Uncharacterized protein n=1 Tax=Cichorium intybus TaxID=13427 RepID=A0ACB9F8T8_CICIN|nr:hypothetical protein L2E82_17149 [Cichorium intybus]
MFFVNMYNEYVLGNLDYDEGKSEEIGHDDELGSGTNQDVNLNLSLGGEPSSSSAMAVLERDGLDRDSHNKRHKVHYLAL